MVTGQVEMLSGKGGLRRSLSLSAEGAANCHDLEISTIGT